MRPEEHVRRCAVLGSPIGHSLSPVLHRAAYAELGLPWRYDAFEVDEEGLPAFLEGLDASWRGLSLTMPLKRAVIPLCDEVAEPARLVGAVNTVLLAGGRRTGTNTDVPGVIEALRERGVTSVREVLLVGVGATASSALAAAAAMDASRVWALARDPARAQDLHRLAAELGVDLRVVAWDDAVAGLPAGVDLAVSTVPDEAAAPVAAEVARRAEVVFDALYDPWPTRLAEAAGRAGRVVVGGLDLLVHQAALQVEQMTGKTSIPVATMRAAGEEALRDRAG
ncbi:shikimate dehydrogenase [Actinopolymorpha cephalotaxi]|uniref:Shikimate dehydrogenase n=1 Tax=Actinopolymorpha cephalotaxi TaxID=504797 RepID=A0A1I2PUZ6_9ACTN|nr:shikimate dehydrogenase [Actinopolymorpha cephalotaxi]NYH83461.1 shikimate dehydrogenase [Actinopolymorpha cephalotaxi]SFG19894.1 shikimate dehydrogenase [Actinopolymorpha cephalotaxi]